LRFLRSAPILEVGVNAAFRESTRYAEQNLYARGKDLVGNRDPCEHEFAPQLRAMDADRTGASLGLPVLLALPPVGREQPWGLPSDPEIRFQDRERGGRAGFPSRRRKPPF
jgi:hypothetical protein